MTTGGTVTELTGSEGGVWHVHTRDSIHILDLDAWTVERKPGPNTWAHPSDRPRKLRTIHACRVGERGHWTMRSDDIVIDYYFHFSSIIQRIDRVAAEDPAQEESQEPTRVNRP